MVCPQPAPDGKIFCPVLLVYRPIFFVNLTNTARGPPGKFMRLSDFPRSDNFFLLQRKFFCVMLRLASGKEAVVMTNAMCASLMHTTSAQAPCAASSCADMHAILGIIILDASLLLRSVFVLLSSVTRTVRSLPSLQAC